MPRCENKVSVDIGVMDQRTATFPHDGGNSMVDEDNEGEEEYDEDEDQDFNPFLKETPSPAASSNLSSENKCLDGKTAYNIESDVTIHCSGEISGHVGDSEHDEEESMMQSNISSEGLCERELEESLERKARRKKLPFGSYAKIHTLTNEEIGMCSRTKAIDGAEGDLSDGIQNQKFTINSNDEDAICMRTRARYSLESCTLEELEAFLQETEDEDDLQNADDEEEYRKFLAGVLQGGDDGDGQLIQETENSDDDANDMDFEMELEEELESDDDEGTRNKTRTKDNEVAGRRPETRQKKGQKACRYNKKNSQEQTKRRLRSLVPILPSLPMAPAPTVDRRNLYESGFVSEDGMLNAFAPHQLGQLHCLIHEHVQLLIQVYSLCVLDPSRQHIASQLQCLMREMLDKCNELKKRRSEPHPGYCFHPPYARSSLLDDSLNWMPIISCPVLSVTDVAPLNLVGQYLDDVCTAIHDYRRRHLESNSDTLFEKEPLFPLLQCTPQAEGNDDALMENTLPSANSVLSASNQQHPKKTLAATLVESARKQCIALVRKDIAKLALRFLPLFNPSLFPHKPPSAAVANRVLFTEAEDELLALGLMECNSDWKTIKQRFLPCKSEHQIFVRQKNRCSSKAPENPIKMVRRMKNSPLTPQEVACIQEGLKYFKYDWMSMCRFIVPYRDPSLLPRQLRIASGTQKSYKHDAAQKEKRRSYALKQRSKAASFDRKFTSCKEDNHVETNGNRNCSGDDVADNSGETYLHEGFLADWRPGNSDVFRSMNNLPGHAPVRYQAEYMQQAANSEHMEAQGTTANMNRLPFARSYTLQSNCQVPNQAPSSCTPQIYMRPYRARKSYNPRMVRLAPDLPLVNLPPSVRVIPQSALKRNHLEASKKSSAVENVVPQPSGDTGRGAKVLTNPVDASDPKDTSMDINQEEAGVVKEKGFLEERNTDLDHMHPLLFQDPENRRLSYYPVNCTSGSSSSFSFFSAHQPQLLSLFSSPKQVNHVDSYQKFMPPKACSVDFHPLLQRCDNAYSNLLTGCGSLNQVTELSQRSETLMSAERAKEADLNIQPSSMPTKEKGLGNDFGHFHGRPPDHTLASENVTGRLRVDSPSLHQNEIGSGAQETGDDSNLEIVMEQEELSDSDEEIEEHVEFECEEMADSEVEEGIGCEEIAEMHDKDVSSPMVEKTRIDGDSSLEGGIQNLDQCQGACAPCFSKSSLTELGKDSTSSPWLSLDSRSSDQFANKKAARKHDEKMFGEEPAAEPVQPSRSVNKETVTPKGALEPNEATSIAQLLSLGPLAVSTMKKKPRKRWCRANANLNVRTTSESSAPECKDKSC